MPATQTAAHASRAGAAYGTMAESENAQPMDVDAGEEEASTLPQTQLTLDVLGTIKSAQAQNGLKHGDYMRYRSETCCCD